MTTLDSSQWMYSSASGFYSHTIDQSLRFEDGDSAHLDRTFGSGGNRKTFTISAWVKRGNISSVQYIMSASEVTNNVFRFNADNTFTFYSTFSGSVYGLTTAGVFRDISSWYHVVGVMDTTNSTAADRLRFYVNGVRQYGGTDTVSSITQNTDSDWNIANDHQIGRYWSGGGQPLDAYLAELNFVDGQALEPTSFGETKAGIWIPKDYTGSHGTTGFYLPFDDSSAIGDDESANTNDFTPNGLAATDVVLDSPTNNFATMNPLDGNAPTIKEGNLKVYGDTTYAVFEGFKGTFPMSSGKWYWEVNVADVNNIVQVGITPTKATGVGSSTNLSYHTDAMVYNNVGSKAIGTGGFGTGAATKTTTSYGATYTDGDIIGIALDLDSATTTLTFYKNNSSQGTAFSSLASDEYVALYTGLQNSYGIFNFGQDSSFAGTKTAQGNTDANGNGDFYYTPPSGYLACCSASLPNPGIDPAQDEEPADYFNTVLWTGNDVNDRAVTGVGFQPDWVWIKNRGVAESHNLYDSIRGAGQQLYTDSDDAEFDRGIYGLKSFTSDGFTLGTGGEVNDTSETYVAWNWKVNGGTTTNVSAGSSSNIRLIGGGTADQAAVQANTEAGISIVSFENTARSSSDLLTFPHGLNSTPEMVWVKSRDSANYWAIFHANAGSSTLGFLGSSLGSNAFISSSFWNAVNSSTVKFHSNGNISATNEDIIAYCFHSVDGYSKMGSYTGNGSSDGAFVYTGFRPAWVLLKRTNATANWSILDIERDTSNVMGSELFANLSNSEQSNSSDVDFVSNGFKFRRNYTDNNSSGTYIYLAFADQPLKYSNAR